MKCTVCGKETKSPCLNAQVAVRINCSLYAQLVKQMEKLLKDVQDQKKKKK